MSEDPHIRARVGCTPDEVQRKTAFVEGLRNSTVPNEELLDNIGLYLTRQTLSRISFMPRIYAQMIPVHGVIMEFGMRWGQNLTLFTSLRGTHEPYSYSRRTIGFDTFAGFPAVREQDGTGVAEGDHSMSVNWEEQLAQVLDFHEFNLPVPQKRKSELVRGNATETLSQYLADHPETIAVQEILGISRFVIRRDPGRPLTSWLVIE